MDPNVDSTTDEDFDNRPFKKTKKTETIVFDNPLPSPTISTLESEEKINESALSPDSEVQNEETDPKSKHIIENFTYDYLPQGKIFNYYLYFCNLCYVSVIHPILAFSNVFCRL
jgi:hypothetical protein